MDPDSPLAAFLVIEVTRGDASAYCGWLLARYGATVVLVEPPEGSALRQRGPFASQTAPLEAGAAFLTLAEGKQSLALDLANARDRTTFLELCGRADALITDDDKSLAEHGLDVCSLTQRFPQLVGGAISPFGATGPYRDFVATSATIYAMAGYSFLTGDADREPLQGPEHIPEYIAGVYAYIGILAALIARARMGRGQAVDVSQMEALASAHQWTLARYGYNGRVQRRNGNRYDSLHPVTYYACADGVVALSPSSPDQLERMLVLLGRSELLDDTRFATNVARMANAAAFDEEVAGWFLERTRAEVAAACQEFRVPCAGALEVDEVLAHEQLIARGFWQHSHHPVAGDLLLPAGPFRMGLAFPKAGRAPLLDEHGDLGATAGWRRAANGADGEIALPPSSPTLEPPLTGLCVLDLTRVWSGPLATRILADLGAEIIKVEHPNARGPAKVGNTDPVRNSFYPDNEPGLDPWNRSAAFNKLNRNKMSLTLDLAKQAGAEIFRRLVPLTDVVIENYSPRVMDNLGLSYGSLAALNPRLVMVSMPGYGLDGPLRDGVAYGTTLDAESGTASLMGYADGGPQRLGVALPDPVAGLHAAGAVLTSLLQRLSTGRGEHVDLSQLESIVSFVGEEVVAFQISGERPERMGNAHRSMAPHGIYPCQGQDTWISIAVESNDQFSRLAGIVGRPNLGELYPDVADRLANREILDAEIRTWTGEQDALAAMLTLQANGIPAGKVMTAAHLYVDAHLRSRGFFKALDHPSAGTHDYAGLALEFSLTPAVFRTDAPRLGEHNVTIVGGLLGFDDAALAELERDGVIAQRPLR